MKKKIGALLGLIGFVVTVVSIYITYESIVKARESDSYAQEVSETNKHLSAKIDEFANTLGVSAEDILKQGIQQALDDRDKAKIKEEGDKYESVIEAEHRERANKKYDNLIANATNQLNKQQYNAAFGFLTLAQAYKPESQEVEELLNKSLAGMGSTAKYVDGELSISAEIAEERLVEKDGVILVLKDARRSGNEIVCSFEIRNTTANDIQIDDLEYSTVIDSEGNLGHIKKIRISDNETYGSSEISLPHNRKRSFIARFILADKSPVFALQEIKMNFEFEIKGQKNYSYKYIYSDVALGHHDKKANSIEHANIEITLEKVYIDGGQAACTIWIKNRDELRDVVLDDLEYTKLFDSENSFKLERMIINGKKWYASTELDIPANRKRKVTMLFGKDTNINFGKFTELLISADMFNYNDNFVYKFPINSQVAQK
ncbi:hypothetical protein [Maridesulfovibrio salexigens]|uniref:Uncharacterized protein n=1 Tax=Maridesulfovibrio salexigens (strain ATCC 14822 / DSM 2638 / NCIMB 8403 / VKM B-1763) TaxID=526222 RepID=C6BVZ4_MARSD|nr:hypothetical protein [Maridesulfovibrio salexigens]ACS80197.1 hypothetical protein Desal_2138 [Maridesulfovibrio salexigens DSM 2638]